jgi:hypothetical protein
MRTPTLVMLGVIAAGAVEAQSLADRIMAPRNGTVRMTFASRPELCGDGETFISDRSRGENNYVTYERSDGRGWRRACLDGPARVAISLFDGSIRRVRVYVGGAWRNTGAEDVHDLGVVSAPRAAEALLALARQNARGKEAIFAATVADSAQVGPALLRLAKDDRTPRESRKTAVFWLSQMAGDSATAGLEDLATDDDEDREVREQAVFALSQLRHDEGIPALIKVARTNADPGIRRKAIFWLGQSDDPRVLALFEELLTKPR